MVRRKKEHAQQAQRWWTNRKPRQVQWLTGSFHGDRTCLWSDAFLPFILFKAGSTYVSIFTKALKIRSCKVYFTYYWYWTSSIRTVGTTSSWSKKIPHLTKSTHLSHSFKNFTYLPISAVSLVALINNFNKGNNWRMYYIMQKQLATFTVKLSMFVYLIGACMILFSRSWWRLVAAERPKNSTLSEVKRHKMIPAAQRIINTGK